jgi:hypothetical protein
MCYGDGVVVVVVFMVVVVLVYSGKPGPGSITMARAPGRRRSPPSLNTSHTARISYCVQLWPITHGPWPMAWHEK